MRAGSRCEKSASSSRLIVPPVVCPGTSYAGPFALLSTENRIFSFLPPPVVPPPGLVPPPVLLPPHAVAARASSPLTATSRTPVLRLMYEPFVYVVLTGTGCARCCCRSSGALGIQCVPHGVAEQVEAQ